MRVHKLYEWINTTYRTGSGAGGPKLIQLVSLSLISEIILAGASIALTFSPIRNDLPYIELSINFAFKISRAVNYQLGKVLNDKKAKFGEPH